MAAVSKSDEKVESVEDYTQELSGSHTSSPTSFINNDNSSSSVGPQQCQSLDTHQSILNGSQSNPFVCGGVLVAPHTDNSLPLGALVNGSASHCTSEEPQVPNKDAPPLPWTDTNCEVLEPPCELQSNTWRKPEGHILKATSARTLHESDSSDSDTPLVWHNADNRPISQLQTSNGFEAGSLWDVDCDSESSSENYEGLNKNLREKFMCLLLKGGILDGVVKTKMEVEGLQANNLIRGKQKICKMERMPVDGNVKDGFGYNPDLDCNLFLTKEPLLKKEPESLKAYMEPSLGNYCNKKSLISIDKEGGHDEAENDVGGKPVPLKKILEMGLEPELSFFQCTKCDANFKEKKQLQRHMMYHLDQHNQVRQESMLRPFICKECGRSFRESSSLQKHMLIHQLRQERLMKEIKGLNEMRNKGSQHTTVTSCPQTLIHHTKAHEKDEAYYSCEECDHVTLSKEDMEAHQRTTHLNIGQDRFHKTFGMYFCKICTFTSQSRNVFRKHLELIHDQAFPNEELNSLNTRSVLKQNRLADQTQAQDLSPTLHKRTILSENQNCKSGLDLSGSSNGLDVLYPSDNSAQKSCDELSSSLFKRCFGNLANNLSSSSLQCDKTNKLSPSTERMAVTTGLWNVAEDNQKCERTNYLSSFDTHLVNKSATFSKIQHLNSDTDDPTKDPSASDLLVQTPRQKSPSKRKMSIPSRNVPRSTACILPKHEPASLEEMPWQDHDPSHGWHTESTNILNGNEDDCSPYATDHFIPQELYLKEEDAHDYAGGSAYDGNAEDNDEITTFVVKEENFESALSEDSGQYLTSDPHASYSLSPLFEVERKCCPYCPAVFDSGVGLSNHIRGHLHRLGLRYEARHMLSPEQVASQDWQPRIRRRVHTMSKGIRRADKPDSQAEYTCPLCLGWFDTKTGLSNHVRGHLKRIGKPISGLSKSPLSILTELLQDEQEHGNVLQALVDKPCLSKPFLCRKFAGSEGLFLTPTGIPVKIQHASEVEEKRKRREKMNRVRETSSSTLVELLKRRRLDEEQEETGRSQAGRARFMVSPCRRVSPGDQYQEHNSICNQEKFEPNKKICIHCNAIFQSGVSLSNHLRAYERRKRIALQEGLSYGCNPICARSRSIPKMKPLQTARTSSEVIYTLACRFCDLVFVGPQCVQEDWVKHLQRHLMHTTVSGSGAPMVEIPAVCDGPCDQDHVTQGL